MNALAPELLYRLTYSDKFRFDESGYLLPHDPENWLRKLAYKGRVPMVTENDWSFVAKFFASNRADFLKLTIASDQTELLTAGKHGYLVGPEFFAKVTKNAIAKVEQCQWENGVCLMKPWRVPDSKWNSAGPAFLR